jgi:signal transduction histidine kinase
MKILLVEDDDFDAEWVRRALKGIERFSLERAETLSGGLDLLQKGDFGLVLSDLHLPDALQTGVFQAIAQKVPLVPVILLTGDSDDRTAIEAVQQGAQDYLVKGEVDARGLVRAIDYAVERNRLLVMREHFVHIVSHEIKNPLGNLKASLALMRGGYCPGERDREEILRIAANAVERLIATTSDLLDLAKMESGKVELKAERFDLNAMLQELGRFLEPALKKKGLALKNLPPGREMPVVADPGRIWRVFFNLAHNAIEYTQEGSVEFSAEDGPEGVRCCVSDTGPGIPESDLPRLFLKFSRVGSRKGKGTGLGLSICREIVELHRGRLWAENTPGRGAKFTFTIPKV